MFVVARLIINKINKVQWVDFKLENVLISLHSLETMALGSIIFKEWRVTRTFVTKQILEACIRLLDWSCQNVTKKGLKIP
jgi:hypothetical protein